MKIYFTFENLFCFGRCHVKPTCMMYDQDVLFWKMSYSAHMYKVQIKLKRNPNQLIILSYLTSMVERIKLQSY